MSRAKKSTRAGALSISMKTISVFGWLLYATWAEGANINVEGFEGGEASFLCSHKLAWNNNKYLCKEDCKESEAVLVRVKSGGRAQSGRTALVDLGNGAFNVTFRQLQLSDSGKYWCGVDRLGVDTYISVFLTVKEVIAQETTVTPDVSTTWSISSSTQLTFGQPTTYTSGLANQSTSSNCSEGAEPSISTSMVLSATVGVVTFVIVILTVSVVSMRSRKCKDFICADESESDYDDVGEMLSVKKTSEKTFYSPYTKPDRPKSASRETGGTVCIPIYENICRGTTDSRQQMSKPSKVSP
ncbi:CMRF35-like molecule 3 [Echeneis naucrates]|uniref:CMRF35-like molecule 3 n=1 Tax=Echeneis naucrates TaxID=173247 RepID=UPI001113F9F8|nr:CMRF35-like molecule 3 [Echeneis naucrates]